MIDNDLNEMLSLYNEAYFGKNPKLMECEGFLSRIRDELVTLKKNPNNLKEVKDFERNFEVLFGFEKVHLTIIAEEQSYNAFTIPFFHVKNYSDEFFAIEKSSDGIRFKSPKNKELYVYVHSSVIRDFNNETVMGIILHEVGHNFFIINEDKYNTKLKTAVRMVLSINNYIVESNGRVNWGEIIKTLLDISYYVADPQKYMMLAYKPLSKDEAFKKLNKDIENDKVLNRNFIVSALNIVSTIVGGLVLIPANLIFTIFLPLSLITNFTKSKKMDRMYDKGYSAEKFCDNFAASYGYATGVVDFFSNRKNKTPVLASDDRFQSKIPLVRINYYYTNMLLYYMYCFDEEHPDSVRRFNEMKSKLEYELDKNGSELSEKQVAELREDLRLVTNGVKAAPFYKKFVYWLFKPVEKLKDRMMTDKYTNEKIYDFDKTFLKGYIDKGTKEGE